MGNAWNNKKVPYEIRTSAPSATDINYRIPTIWIDSLTNRCWILLDVTAGVATWREAASDTIPMTTITDPALNAAVTTAIVDAYSGIVVTLGSAGSAQTIQDPTDITPGKKFTFVADDSNGAYTIEVNGITISAGESQSFIWDGSAWVPITAVDADDITFTPYGNIAATNVQGAIQELDDEKLALAGGTMTGDAIFNDGIKVKLGTGSDGEIYSSSDDLYIKNVTQDKDIIFAINDGGVDTEVFRIDGSESSVVFDTKSITGVNSITATTLTDGTLSINSGAITGGTTAVFATKVTTAEIENAAAITIDSTGAGVNITTHSDAGDDFTVNTSALVVEGDTGYVGIGTDSPTYKLQVENNAAANTNYIFNASHSALAEGNNCNAVASFMNYTGDSAAEGTGQSHRIIFSLGTARGTMSAPVQLKDEDYVYSLSGNGYINGVFRQVSEIRTVIDGTPSSTSYPGALTFHTTPDGGVAILERMRIDSSGNVGIGSTSPVSLLEARGAVLTPGTLTLSTAELTVVDGDELGRINFQAPVESSGTDAILVGAAIWGEASDTFAADNNSTDIVFGTNTSGVATERIRIDSEGNVGVNLITKLSAGLFETTIIDKMEIASLTAGGPSGITIGGYGNLANESGQLTLRKSNNSLGNPVILTDNSVLGIVSFKGFTNSFIEGAKIEARVNGTPSAGNDLPTELTFWTTPDGSGSPSQRMTIDNSGNVGIGTTSPSDNLTITDGGTNTHTSIILNNYSDQLIYGNILQFNKSSTDSLGTLAATQNTQRLGRINFNGVLLDDSAFYPAARIDVLQEGNATNNGVPAYIKFDTNDGTTLTERMRITSAGYVGIGITTPATTHVINGGQAAKRTDGGAGDYNPSALTTDYLITVDNSAAARAVTISTEDVQSGSTANPRVFIIKDEEGAATTNNITVSLESGNIDGAATAVISSNYDSITLYCDGTNAFII